LDFSQTPAPTAVACNSEGIVVLFEDGTIGVADANGVRIPEFKSPVSSEKEVSPEKEEDSIVQIACNRTHAYIRTKIGKLYKYVTRPSPPSPHSSLSLFPSPTLPPASFRTRTVIFFLVFLLFYYFIILLFYYFIILLFYYFIILLFYYFIILLFYYLLLY
jgi:hypothetical protein